jgi:dihydroorotase
MTLRQFARATAGGPATTWDIYHQKGRSALGSDGDLTIIDIDKTGVIRDDELHSKNHVTPCDGQPTRGATRGHERARPDRDARRRALGQSGGMVRPKVN